MHIQWDAATPLASIPPPLLHTFDPAMDDEASETWHTILDTVLPPLWPIEDLLTLAAIDAAAASLQGAVHDACSMAMKHHHAPGAHTHSWWTDECALVAQMLQDASEDTRDNTICTLHRVTISAKCTWADWTVTTANVWDVAKWRHSHKSSAISALQDTDGSLVFDTDRVAALLTARFFVDDPSNICLHQPDDPPPRPMQPFNPFSANKLECYLKETSSKSAPGLSGQTWGILKMAWPTAKDHFTTLANTCIWVGHHPSSWKTALVIVIPKPGRDDYTAAKNYHPISLLECFSKLLEKAVSKHFLYDIDAHRLIPTT